MASKKKAVSELNFPDNIYYHSEHTWAKVDGDQVIIGITDYAQDQLGEIIFVELPGLGVRFNKGEVFGQAESAKIVSALYCPVSGEVVTVNEEADDNPELINQDPYGQGWQIIVKVSDPEELSDLLNKEQYINLIAKD